MSELNTFQDIKTKIVSHVDIQMEVFLIANSTLQSLNRGIKMIQYPSKSRLKAVPIFLYNYIFRINFIFLIHFYLVSECCGPNLSRQFVCISWKPALNSAMEQNSFRSSRSPTKQKFYKSRQTF